MRSRVRRDLRQRRQANRVPPLDGVTGRRFLIAGLFSAKAKDIEKVMTALGETLISQGGEILGLFTQRRGISHCGKATMDQPFSQRTLMTTGKIDEIASAVAMLAVDAVVFVNPLTDRQRHVLASIFHCPALTRNDITPAAQ